jgi:putative MATE family efflux protein
MAPLARLAAPLVGLNLLNVLALAVDTAMVGSLASSESALAGLGFATQLAFLLLTAMMGVSVGAVTLISRAYGAGDEVRTRHLLAQARAVTVLIGVSVGVLGTLGARPLARLLGAEGAALEDALSYLRPLIVGSTLNYLAILYAGAMRAVGNTWVPLRVGLIASLLNVVVNSVLIGGGGAIPPLGVAGAAYGTLASQALSLALLSRHLRKGDVAGLGLRSPGPWPRLDVAVARSFLRIGGPAALDFAMLNVAYLAVIGLLGHTDALAVAAHGVGMRIQLLAFAPAISISQATAALVGQHLGAARPDRARATVRAALVQSLALMTALPVAVLAAAPPLLEVFGVTPGTALGELTLTWMTIMGASLPILGANIVFVGMMQGAGATLTSLGINSLATLGLQVPFAWLAGDVLGLGAVGVWLSVPVCFGTRAVLGLGVFRRGRWAEPRRAPRAGG